MGWGQVLVVASGVLDVEFRGSFWQLRPGWALWTPGSGLESARAWDETRVLCLEWESSPRLACAFRCSALLQELMFRLSEIGELRFETLVRALLLLVQDELERAWTIPLTPPWPRSAWLEKAAIVLRGVGPDEAPIELLAEKIEMSVKALGRRFERETGLSPFEFRRKARVIEAVRLMSLGIRIEDIVSQVGFRSRNALNEAFQDQYGMSPARFWRGISGG